MNGLSEAKVAEGQSRSDPEGNSPSQPLEACVAGGEGSSRWQARRGEASEAVCLPSSPRQVSEAQLAEG